MAWSVDEIMAMAAKNGKTTTREQAAFHAFCFNEAERLNESPITIALKYINEAEARQNLGKISPVNTTKRTYQL